MKSFKNCSNLNVSGFETCLSNPREKKEKKGEERKKA